MAGYPGRPSTKSTLLNRIGQRPEGQLKQNMPNDILHGPASGRVMENMGGPSGRPWMAGQHPAAVGMLPAGGETMIDRFNRERGFYNGRPSGYQPQQGGRDFQVPPPGSPFEAPQFRDESLMPTPQVDLGLGQSVPPRPSAMPQAVPFESASAMSPANMPPQFRPSYLPPDPRGPRYMTPGEINSDAKYRGAYGAPGGLDQFQAPPSPAVGGSRPALSGRLPSTPIDLSRPAEQRDLQYEHVTNRPDTAAYTAGRHTYEEMAAAREELRDRNLSQLNGIGRPTPAYEGGIFTPEQRRYLGANGPQMPLTNTRFVDGMGETPRDLSGKNGVNTYKTPYGREIGYIPQYGTSGSVGNSRFVEGSVRETGSGLMSIERNPRTGGIMLSGGGRPLSTDNQQEIYEKRTARAQDYKDTRAARAYSRNPGLARMPAVTAMLDRRGDVEYERTKGRRRDAMLEQVEMAALQQQLRGMTPEQLTEFLGGMENRPKGGVSVSDATAFKDKKDKEGRLGWQKWFAGPATMGLGRFHQLAR